MSKDDTGAGTAAGAAGSVGWNLPMSGKTGTTEASRSSGFLGFTNQYAAANYIYDDSTDTGCAVLVPAAPVRRQRQPVRRQRARPDLVHRDEADRQQLRSRVAAADRPPLRRRRARLEGAQCRGHERGHRAVSGCATPASRSPTSPTPVNSTASYGAVVGTSPTGQTVPGSIITIQISNGIPPPPPPPPPGAIPGSSAADRRRQSSRFLGCRRSPCRCSGRLRRRPPPPGMPPPPP